MTSADWSTNGSCIWPEPNSSPTTFMPSSSVSLTMSSAGRVCQRLVEVGLQAVLLAVDDAPLEPLVQREGGQFLGAAGLPGLGGGALEEGHQLLQRVVTLGAAVVDQVEGGGDLLLAEAGDRQDLRRRGRSPSPGPP